MNDIIFVDNIFFVIPSQHKSNVAPIIPKTALLEFVEEFIENAKIIVIRMSLMFLIFFK